MSPKVNPTLVSPLPFFVLVVLMTFSANTIQSKSTNHNFFKSTVQSLEGCHKGQNLSGLHHLKQYLHTFGYYLNNHNINVPANEDRGGDEYFDDALEAAVESYQRNFHLKVTGTLDTATVKQITMPRCGVPDIIANQKEKSTAAQPRKVNKNRKLFHVISRYQFFPGNPCWPPTKTLLTYHFRSSVTGIPGTENIRSICARAFAKWSQVSSFTFQEVPDNSEVVADIEIGFHRGDHGDNHPFDGPGGNTVAHAFAPTRGWLHFDADEAWSESPTENEFDLESVAVHEIGHLLGIGHEPRVPDAVMYPGIFRGQIKRNLHEDDIRGIHALYDMPNCTV